MKKHSIFPFRIFLTLSSNFACRATQVFKMVDGMQGKGYEDNTIARPTWQYSGFRISNDLGLLFFTNLCDRTNGCAFSSGLIYNNSPAKKMQIYSKNFDSCKHNT